LAIALARLGHRCRRLGFVSDDSIGDFIVAQHDAAFVHGKLRTEATAVEVLTRLGPPGGADLDEWCSG
jgi:sugar/nucleoside kinase (ribokinase family)